MAFDNGRVSGSGTDIIGLFTLTGELHGENVTLVKQYVQQHRVDYVGNFDGEGTLRGTWHVGRSRGAWMIKIVSLLDEVDMQQFP